MPRTLLSEGAYPPKRQNRIQVYDPFCPQCQETTDRFFFHSLTEAVCTYCGGPVRTCSRCGSLHSSEWHTHKKKRLCQRCYQAGAEQRSVEALSQAQVCRWCRRPGDVDYKACCRDCGATEVVSLEHAEELLMEVLDFLAEELGLLVPASYDLELDPDRQEPGGWVRERRAMRMRPGLPSWLFAAVVAHQHTHAWQALECQDQSPTLVEALARWAQLQVLQALGSPQHYGALHQDRKSNYERGLNWLREMEPSDVVREVRRMRDLPLWVYQD